ncbi:hypothetical protein [Sorangium sp. So ce542]|uniref:hypothetical protein n=1 Tax=Sorangium sp. So ce542 TaxID=3133316 RepID=UPI003F60FFD5
MHEFASWIPRRGAAALAVLLCGACDADVDPPTVQLNVPEGGEIVGVAEYAISVSVADESDIASIVLSVDGVPIGGPRPPGTDCDGACALTHPWNTMDFAEGEHTVVAIVADEEGNVGRDSASIHVRDGVFVQEIQISNQPDDGVFGGGLDVEVHLRDAQSDQFLGCAGDADGMVSVINDDERFTVAARFQRANVGGPLPFAEIADSDILMRVVEDDADACPAPDSGSVDTNDNDDDLVGVSASIDAATLRSGWVSTFDDVVHVKLLAGRLLSL